MAFKLIRDNSVRSINSALKALYDLTRSSGGGGTVTISDVTGLTAALEAKADDVDLTTKADIADLDEINKGSIGENYLVRYDDITGDFYTFNPNIFTGRMAFEVGVTAGFGLNGQTQIADNNFIDRAVTLIIKKTAAGVTHMLFPDIDYTHDSGGGLIELTVALATNDKVIIYTTWPFIYNELSRDSIPVPPNFDDFDFDPAHDLEELTANTWTVKGAASSPYHAVAAGGLKLPSVTDGAYRFQTAATNNGIIGFDNTNTDHSYGNFDFWVEASNDGQIRVGSNTTGSTLTGITWTVGDWVSIWREGSTVKCKKSSDGSSWSDVFTYALTTSGDLFPKAQLFGGQLKNPQGYNFSV